MTCAQAAAQAINDRWPGERVCKGTLSRRLSGDLPPPPVHHVLALEDELGIYPVTNWMARRAHTVQEAPDVMQAVETAAKEIGEAVAQMPRAVLDLDDARLGRVLAEIREAIEAMRALERALEGKGVRRDGQQERMTGMRGRPASGVMRVEPGGAAAIPANLSDGGPHGPNSPAVRSRRGFSRTSQPGAQHSMRGDHDDHLGN